MEEIRYVPNWMTLWILKPLACFFHGNDHKIPSLTYTQWMILRSCFFLGYLGKVIIIYGVNK